MTEFSFTVPGVPVGKTKRLGNYGTRPAIERFRAKIVTIGSCWVWLGGLDQKGYARFRDDLGRKVSAHRFAWETHNGPIPEGLVIDHLCRNRCCCNPAHLEPVTNAENIRRGFVSWRKFRTHCKHGHEYTQENTRMVGTERRCRECTRTADRRQYHAKRGGAT